MYIFNHDHSRYILSCLILLVLLTACSEIVHDIEQPLPSEEPPKGFLERLATGRTKYHIENAANLSDLPTTGARVIVVPIKIKNGTGGPARILSLVQDVQSANLL